MEEKKGLNLNPILNRRQLLAIAIAGVASIYMNRSTGAASYTRTLGADVETDIDGTILYPIENNAIKASREGHINALYDIQSREGINSFIDQNQRLKISNANFLSRRKQIMRVSPYAISAEEYEQITRRKQPTIQRVSYGKDVFLPASMSSVTGGDTGNVGGPDSLYKLPTFQEIIALGESYQPKHAVIYNIVDGVITEYGSGSFSGLRSMSSVKHVTQGLSSTGIIAIADQFGNSYSTPQFNFSGWAHEFGHGMPGWIDASDKNIDGNTEKSNFTPESLAAISGVLQSDPTYILLPFSNGNFENMFGKAGTTISPKIITVVMRDEILRLVGDDTVLTVGTLDPHYTSLIRDEQRTAGARNVANTIGTLIAATSSSGDLHGGSGGPIWLYGYRNHGGGVDTEYAGNLVAGNNYAIKWDRRNIQ